METHEQKKRRLFGKKYLQQYLMELTAITNIDITSQMLLSIAESDSIGKVNRDLFYKITVNFQEKKELLLLMRRIIKLKNGPLFLHTAYSSDCGVLKLNDLDDFNINFKFGDEHSGLIRLTLQDLTNELVFDFYEQNNQRFLDIEIYGHDWPKAQMGSVSDW